MPFDYTKKLSSSVDYPTVPIDEVAARQQFMDLFNEIAGAHNTHVADVTQHFLNSPYWYGAKGDYDPLTGLGTDDTVAFQAALDAKTPLTLVKDYANFLITDSLKVYKNTVIEGSLSESNYLDDALATITFKPTTKKDLFITNELVVDAANNPYIYGITIGGFSVTGVNGRYVFNLPKMSNLHLFDIKQFGGFDYGMLVDGYIDTDIDRCSFQGTVIASLHVIITGYITTTTRFNSCYFSQGDKGMIVEESAVMEMTFNDCIFESLNMLADIYTGNNIFINDPHIENLPKTDAGYMFNVGVNGAKTDVTKKVKLVISGGYINGHIPSTAVGFINADWVSSMEIDNTKIEYFNELLNFTANTDSITLKGINTVGVSYLGSATNDWSKVTVIGGYLEYVLLDNSHAEYLKTPNIISSIALNEKYRADIVSKSIFLDKLDKRLKFKDEKGNIRKVSNLEASSSTATFNGERLQKGEVIYNNVIAKGQPVGWISEKFSNDIAIALAFNTGVSTSGSPIITTVIEAGFWEFKVNDYVTLSAGLPSTTEQYRIISVAVNQMSITLDTNATISATDIAVQIPVHSLIPFGQIGHRESAGTPVGALIPFQVKEEVLDTTNKIWYKATGLTNADWKALNA